MNNLSLLFLNIGGSELLIILLGVFVIFGPRKLPEIARTLGRFTNQMRKASSDIQHEFNRPSTKQNTSSASSSESGNNQNNKQSNTPSE